MKMPRTGKTVGTDAKGESPVPAECFEAPSAEGIEMDILPQLLGFQLRKAQVRIFNSFLKSLGDAGITPSDFGLLVVIGANRRLNQNALARAIGSNRSLLVAMINKLEARGLVARLKSEEDKRAHALVLSRRGDVLIKRLKGIVQNHERAVTAPLSEEERQMLLRLLVRLNSSDEEAGA